jgi:hypothetical protein
MEKAKEGASFRWQDGDQLSKEIERMDTKLAELAKCTSDDTPKAFGSAAILSS